LPLTSAAIRLAQANDGTEGLTHDLRHRVRNGGAGSLSFHHSRIARKFSVENYVSNRDPSCTRRAQRARGAKRSSSGRP